jgi:digeranylgeranylglycerophospholipid reductase
MHDVLVVGGGPGGLLAGALCAEAGLDVVVCEEHDEIGRPTHCTGIISLETAEFAKIPDEIVLSRLTRAVIVAPGGGRAVGEWGEDSREPILVVDRGEFDRVLARRAADVGATLRTGARVTALERDATGVTATVNGTEIRAAACVLACGVSYRFQRGLGLGLPGATVHTAQVEVDAAGGDDVEVYVGRAVADGGFLWVVPLLRDGRPRAKIGLMAARGDAAGRLTAFLEGPEARGRFGPPGRPPLRRLLPLMPLPKTYADRVLVVGDAAGLTKPTTGGGIFYSLLSAALAAQTLVDAARGGRLDEAALARYEERWQAVLGPEIRVASLFRQILARSTDPQIDRFVAAFADRDLQAALRTVARFNWHRGAILEMLRHAPMAALLLRRWFA